MDERELNADEAAALEEANGAPWLTTFCDMVMLFLSFFVLLSSFARTDAGTFHSALGSVRKAFGVPPPGVMAPAQPAKALVAQPPLVKAPPRVQHTAEPQTPAVPEISAAEREQRLVQRLQDFLVARGLRGEVEVSSTERGIVLRTGDQILFTSASTILRYEAAPVLDAVRDVAMHFNGQLAVEGHTDDRRIQNEEFPSNWELSQARAAAVLHYLLHVHMDPTRVHVTGYADQRPIASNDTEEGRSKNRRVEFVFECGRGIDPSSAFDLPSTDG
jgi:chemotaxis protein MotB